MAVQSDPVRGHISVTFDDRADALLFMDLGDGCLEVQQRGDVSLSMADVQTLAAELCRWAIRRAER